MIRIDLVGIKFNKLEVVKELPKRANGHRYFECRCDCGNLTEISFSHIRTKAVKSCGCALDQRWEKSRYFKGVGLISEGWWRGHVLRQSKDEKSNRQKWNVEVTLQEAWDIFVKQDGKCALSGIPLVFSNFHKRNGEYYGRAENTASLDRIDSTKGYTVDNIQWTHKHINFMKARHSNDYFIELCKKVANNDNRKET